MTRVVDAPWARAARLAEGQVDPAGLRVVGMDGDVHQPAVLPHPDRRQAGDRRAGDAVAEDAQPPRALGHEQRAVRQDHGLPRVLEAVDDGLDPEPVLFGCHDAGRQRRRPGARQRCAGGALAQLADVDHHRPDVLLVQRGAERRHRRARPAVLDAGGDLGVTAAVRPGVVEQARRRAAAAVGAVTVGAHLPEGADDAARRLGGLCAKSEARPLPRRGSWRRAPHRRTIGTWRTGLTPHPGTAAIPGVRRASHWADARARGGCQTADASGCL